MWMNEQLFQSSVLIADTVELSGKYYVVTSNIARERHDEERIKAAC